MASGAKVISLSFEMEVLAQATEGVRSLVDATLQASILSEPTQHALAESSALLSLISTRIRDLDRVVRGVTNAEHFHARHNHALADVDDMQDVRADDNGLHVAKPKVKAKRSG